MGSRGPRRTSPIKKRVGARLRELREAKALSQAELGRRAGTSATQIATVERGERAPTVVSLEYLARALGVSVAAFFEEHAHEQKPPSRGERAWFAIMDQLRDRDVEYLRAARKLLAAFDEALERGGSKDRGR